MSGLTADITDATNSGSNDDSITNNATPTIAGQTEAGATVTILYLDATSTQQTATGTADENGAYSITLDDGLPEGTNSLNIKAIDAAGNETKIMHDVTIDTTATSAPTIAIAGDTNADGVYNAAELGEDGTVTATISIPTGAVAGDTVTYQVDDADAVSVVLTDALISSGIAVEIEPKAKITATITDGAGNTSTEATATAVDADTTATAAPSVRILSDGNDDGTISNSEIDGKVYVLVSLPGGAVAGDTLTVSGQEDVILTQVHIDGGEIEFEYDRPADGEELKVDASITDAAGNTSATRTDSATMAVNEAPVATDDSTMVYSTGIRLDEEPEYGVMEVKNDNDEWVEMTLGVTYDSDTEVRFVPDTEIEDSTDFKIGSFDANENPESGTFGGSASVSDWGDLNDEGAAVITFNDGAITVTTSVSDGVLTAWNNENGKEFVGFGIGNEDDNGLSREELLTIDVDSNDISINKVSFTLSGLGNSFDEKTAVSITANFADGTSETISGNRESGEYEDTYSFITDKAVESFVLTTIGGNGDYVVQNMTISHAISDEIVLTTLQADGSETTTNVKFDPSDVSEDGTVSLTSRFANLLDGNLTKGAIATDEDTVITIDVLANDYDPDGDELEITDATVTSGEGTVSIVDGKLEFTPANDFSGDVTIKYEISDGELTSEASVQVTVDAVADAPTLEVSLSEAEVEGSIVINESDVVDLGSELGDNFTNSSNLLGDIATREFDFGTEYAGQEVTISFDSVISGGWEDGLQNNRLASVETADTYAITINGKEQDQFTYEQNTGTLVHRQSNSYTVILDEDGKATVEFEVASTATSEVVNISNIQASVESLSLISDLTIEGNLTDTDGSETLSYTISGMPEGAELLGSDGTVIDSNEDGTYSLAVDDITGLQVRVDQDIAGFDIEVTVISTDGDSIAQTSQTITVGTPNTAPDAVDDSSTTLNFAFAGLVGEYYGTDSQIDSLDEFLAIVQSNAPTATFNATTIDYSSNGPTDEGTSVATGNNLQTFLGDDADSLSSDPGNNTDGGIHLQGYIFLAAGTYNFQVHADDGYQILVDEKNVASISSNQSPGTDTFESFEIAEDGYYSIDMVWWDQGGDYVFQPTISSDGGNTYVTLDSSILSSVDGSPLITTDEQSIIISADTLLANDMDGDGDTLSISSISNVQNGYAYLNSAGSVVFIATAGFSGTATFDYTITDGKGGYDTATASVEVTESSILPTVTVTVSELSSIKQVWAGFSSSSDADDSYQNYNSYKSFDSSDHNIYISGSVSASLELGSGNDNVHIKNDVQSGGYIALGDGSNNLIVEGSVNHSISSGSGNDQIQLGGDLSASINLGGGNNYLSIAANVNTGAAINMGSGNDELHIDGNVKSAIGLGEGDNKVIIGGDLYSEIGVGGGSDQIQIGGDVSGYIGLGQGNNTLIINGNVSAGIGGGSGDDLIRIDGNVNSDIGLGEGDNVLVIGGNLNAGIGMGTGSDFIVLEGLKAADVYFDGGTTGTDSIVLSSYTSAQYELNIDNIKTKIVGFENILFSDGIIQGDVTAFADYIANDGIEISLNENSSGFSYDVTVDIDNTDATANTSVVSLFGIPSTSTLVLGGATLVANADGSYSIEVEAGETSIDNLTITSSVELPELEITSTVTNIIDDSGLDDIIVTDSYLEGTDSSIADTLLGDLGDDVLFGGDDEVSDILTGAGGSDIFILNDVTDQANIDIIVDFDASEDALDLTDLLVGIEGSPGKDASVDVITEFLQAHVKAEEGDGSLSVTVDGKDVAEFTNATSSLDLNSAESVKVIYNNEEYSINIDG
ncbi:cadherin-like domain-containing protein [Marinomonas ushuaiensis]|uniref:cadherin-like domain-containing protein n=1 Tax=Marinomonas ushuaiensis TaxID=263818 RepID=UPI0012EC3D6B|nr:cadherin-like domain-containing protein [Marinomonas ushuaiensis]